MVWMREAAERFLAEFGGLKVDIAGAGIAKGRESFELNPGDVDSEVDRFADWGAGLGKSLF
ncbi:hypothetical protein H074_25085 [Amycolatopsis decaplanina DSM 44594]|uniref:Uncharacterized protein n=2 Tax=Amycolatopsis decaplanina TaxID=208441 RepID=M2YLT1_9PSEU|nr:hypothetical protein H074_25085 [Amycolatopsis decaplanina DSM 44594]